jgi:NAD(P)-dependent dehydrogenase (short-subunit alcohol dehydrogenase family)
MKDLLQDKVVVVAGGAGLVGSEFVRAIAASGAVAIVADANESGGQALARELAEGKGLCAAYHPLDITSVDSAQALLAILHEKYGRIDALINTAYPRNQHYGRKFEDVTYEDFCQNLSLHVGGYFLMSQQFAKYFRDQGGGTIVNIASVYGVVPPRFEIYEGTAMTMPVEYAAIKSAVIHLSKYMAKYFKGDNVRVNCISPGGILDKQPEMFLERYNQFGMSKGMLSVEDLTGALLFLLSDMSRYVNGQNIVVDDGWTL